MILHVFYEIKEKVDAKPVEGAYVGAEKTSTKEKKVYVKKEATKAVQPAPVEEVAEESAEEVVEEAEEVVEEATEETPVEEVAEEATEETEEKQD